MLGQDGYEPHCVVDRGNKVYVSLECLQEKQTVPSEPSPTIFHHILIKVPMLFNNGISQWMPAALLELLVNSYSLMKVLLCTC